MAVLFNYRIFILLICSYFTYGQNKWDIDLCIEYALNNNSQVKKSKLSSKISEENYKQTINSKYIPTINANANQQINFGRSIDPGSNQFVNQSIISNNIGIFGTYNLFNGLQNYNLKRQNELQLKSSVYEIEKTKVDLIINILNNYLQVLLFNEQLRNSDNQLARSRYIYKRGLELNSIGALPEEDILKLNAQISSDEQSVISIKYQLLQADFDLKKNMQIPMDTKLELDSIRTTDDSNLEDSIPSSKINSLPSVKSQKYKMESYKYSVSSSKGAYLPKINLNFGIASIYSSQYTQLTVKGNQVATVGLVNNDPNQPVISSYPIYSVSKIPFNEQLSRNLYYYLSLNLVIPLLNGRTTKTNYEKAKLNYEASKIDFELIKHQAISQLSQYQASISFAKSKLVFAKQELESNKRSLEIVIKKYEGGYINTLDLLEEKFRYNKSESNYLQCKYEYLFRKKIFEYYVKNYIE